MKVISARRAFAVFCWLIVVSAFAMSSNSAVAASWMIIEPAPGQIGLQARSVDGATLLCPGGAVGTTCPLYGLNLASLGFSTAEDGAVVAAANNNGLLALATLAGDVPNVTAHLQQIWTARSAARTTASIYKVHREIGGPCSGGANFVEGPSPQNCLYAAQLHGAGVAAASALAKYDMSLVPASQADIVSADTQLDQGGVYMAGTLSNGILTAAQFWMPFAHVPIPLDAKPLSQNVPANMYAGHSYSVSVTMQNVGSTSWGAAQAFRLGSQHPQDNFIWGVHRVLLASNEIIAPGGIKTFSFTVVAPSAPGQYFFQWQMLREGVAWFGTKSPDTQVALPTTTELCPGVMVDTTGNTAASAAIQACMNSTPANGSLLLPPGTYLINTQILIDHALTLGTLGLANSALNCDALACAVFRASPNLNDPATGNARGVIQVTGANAALDHVSVDGNRSARLQSQVAAACAQYQNYWGYNVLVLAPNVTFRYSVSANTLCASALGWFGDNAVISDSVFKENGNHLTTGVWSDGITLGSDNSQVLRNRIVNSSDVAIVLMSGTNALVEDNFIEQTTQTAFAGLVVFRQLDGGGNPLSDGDYSGAIVQNNAIECHQRCFLGLHVGARPWENGENARVFGVTVRDNVVSDSGFGISISLAGTAAAPVHVYGNQAAGAFYNPFHQLCPNNNMQNGGSNYNLSPLNDISGNPVDSVIDYNGENPSIYTIRPMCKH